MNDPRMKLPSANHPITIEPGRKRVRVIWQGKVVADSTRTMALDETTHPTVHYFPRADVNMDLLQRSRHLTFCAYKGEASYYSLAGGDETVENAVWSYEDPYPAMEQIRNCLAFYPNKVERIEEI